MALRPYHSNGGYDSDRPQPGSNPGSPSKRVAFRDSPPQVRAIMSPQDDPVSMLYNFFPSSLTTRPDKLEGLSLETLSSQVLEFEGKARANPVEEYQP